MILREVLNLFLLYSFAHTNHQVIISSHCTCMVPEWVLAVHAVWSCLLRS
jgi:hypothetical protein